MRLLRQITLCVPFGLLNCHSKNRLGHCCVERFSIIDGENTMKKVLISISFLCVANIFAVQTTHDLKNDAKSILDVLDTHFQSELVQLEKEVEATGDSARVILQKMPSLTVKFSHVVQHLTSPQRAMLKQMLEQIWNISAITSIESLVKIAQALQKCQSQNEASVYGQAKLEEFLLCYKLSESGEAFLNEVDNENEERCDRICYRCMRHVCTLLAKPFVMFVDGYYPRHNFDGYLEGINQEFALIHEVSGKLLEVI